MRARRNSRISARRSNPKQNPWVRTLELQRTCLPILSGRGELTSEYSVNWVRVRVRVRVKVRVRVRVRPRVRVRVGVRVRVRVRVRVLVRVRVRVRPLVRKRATNFELKQLKPKLDIVKKPENRVHELTDSNVSRAARTLNF